MKAKLNIMIGLIFIAIIVSVIAVSVGWYSAEAGDVTLSGTSVSVVTSDNNYYGNSTTVTAQSILVYEDGVYKAYQLTEYRGQKGIGNGADNTYILLFKATSPIYCNSGSAYVNNVILTKPTYNSIPLDKENSPFTVVLLDQVGQDYVIDTTLETYTYFAVIFSDGSEEAFTYSDISYMGTSFNLNVYFENE